MIIMVIHDSSGKDNIKFRATVTVRAISIIMTD